MFSINDMHIYITIYVMQKSQFIFVYVSVFQFCTNTEVSNKELFPTFARTKPHDSQISKALLSLLNHFSWKKVVFIHTTRNKELAETIEAVSI